MDVLRAGHDEWSRIFGPVPSDPRECARRRPFAIAPTPSRTATECVLASTNSRRSPQSPGGWEGAHRSAHTGAPSRPAIEGFFPPTESISQRTPISPRISRSRIPSRPPLNRLIAPKPPIALTQLPPQRSKRFLSSEQESRFQRATVPPRSASHRSVHPTLRDATAANPPPPAPPIQSRRSWRSPAPAPEVACLRPSRQTPARALRSSNGESRNDRLEGALARRIHIGMPILAARTAHPGSGT